MVEYINEYVEIKGNVSSLNWIMQFLMARSVSFIYDALTKHLFFVQNCPYKRWDIVSQFQCSYSDIQSR